ncbi:MAG: hypothetical protein GX913_07785 [Clostridiales bacterium]|nr:hypothetical protein [Clostridiales bacterium]
MKNSRKYKFTDKNQSIGGIFSSIIALIAIIIFAIGVFISYTNKGNGGLIIGLLGLVSFLLSNIGIYVGVKSFQEDEIFYHFSWIGTISNAIIFVGIFAIILIGI